MMKRILVMMIALLSLTTTMYAQSKTEKADAMIGFIKMFSPVDGKYAVTTYPVTWREYQVVMGEKSRLVNR